jgi:hypothetical protein
MQDNRRTPGRRARQAAARWRRECSVARLEERVHREGAQELPYVEVGEVRPVEPAEREGEREEDQVGERRPAAPRKYDNLPRLGAWDQESAGLALAGRT